MTIVDELVLDENNVAFYPTMGNSYQLNGIGKDIVTLLKEHKSKADIIDELASKYEVSKETLFIDVSDFLSKLRVYGLA